MDYERVTKHFTAINGRGKSPRNYYSNFISIFFFLCSHKNASLYQYCFQICGNFPAQKSNTFSFYLRLLTTANANVPILNCSLAVSTRTVNENRKTILFMCLEKVFFKVIVKIIAVGAKQKASEEKKNLIMRAIIMFAVPFFVVV